MRRDRPFDISKQQCIGHFGFEEIDGMTGLSLVFQFDVLEQVTEDLDQMTLTGSKETGNPDPHPFGDIGILRLVECLVVAIDKLLQVLGHLTRQYKLIEFLPP